jgi:hypothetical protein
VQRYSIPAAQQLTAAERGPFIPQSTLICGNKKR